MTAAANASNPNASTINIPSPNAATPGVAPAPAASDAAVRPINGRRNLIILGVAAVLITLLTTSIELIVYRASGDIYLDRSRPGFLPDADEAAEDNTASSSTYTYSEFGPLDAAELETYLTELQLIQNRLQKLSDPYSDAPLSNASLGISASATSDQSASL